VWLMLILDGDNVILQLLFSFNSVAGHTQQETVATMTCSPGARKEFMLDYCLLWLWLILSVKGDKMS